VAAEKPVIALDGGDRHPGFAQQPVEETARAGPRLAVDETHAGPRDVFRPLDAARVAGGQGEPFLQMSEGHDHHRAASQRAAHEGDVELARLLVEQVRPGDVRVAARKRRQGRVARGADPAEPLAGSAVGKASGQDGQPRVTPRDEQVGFHALARPEQPQATTRQQSVSRSEEGERVVRP